MSGQKDNKERIPTERRKKERRTTLEDRRKGERRSRERRTRNGFYDAQYYGGFTSYGKIGRQEIPDR